MDVQVGSEPMTLGSPTSPKAAHGAQFLPGFLMGDLPVPTSPQPRPFSVMDSTLLKGGSSPHPVVPTPKNKSSAPPVRSIHDGPVTVATPLSAHRQSFLSMQSPVSARHASTSGVQQLCLSPAQVDPFYSQGEALSSEDLLDQTWVTVFGFPPASASYILLQFAQYGNILKHTSVMDGGEVAASPLTSSALPCTPRSAIRPLSATYRDTTNDYQVVSDTHTPRKDDGFVSKALEYMFGW
ncbi:nucleoporin NUP35 isoform X2 [Festucalex cinctus]